MNNKQKIKIIKNGPYRVTGNVPLSEKIIVLNGNQYEYKDGEELIGTDSYLLCRCGRSKKHPFCDGTHSKIKFDGTETASKKPFKERAEVFEGPEITLLDDGRCAYARFCHRNDGDAWDLTENSHDEHLKEEAVIAAVECPAGRLLAVTKDNKEIEPELKPSIEILQDEELNISGPIYVKGYIPIESVDGVIYEVRNRQTLCRCGKSKIKPFCDSAHVKIKFRDKC
ncbi:CDGSH iron-sulfur domain-containing protein [Sedimentibacter sp.]|uniref:CDGSH iron-sulfur domain-containing protein n=1 Tax=Sedimentibacter sp. TaxID=1960295 RepID=UPI0028A7D299|nr:CDGSH iron-sulfur domain-containing protein [Sedimentibacter sp.]